MNVLQTIIDSEPEEVVVYWTSDCLANDCEKKPEETPYAKSARENALSAREGAMNAYERGFCFLTQRRRPDGRFDYLATRAKKDPSAFSRRR